MDLKLDLFKTRAVLQTPSAEIPISPPSAVRLHPCQFMYTRNGRASHLKFSGQLLAFETPVMIEKQ